MNLNPQKNQNLSHSVGNPNAVQLIMFRKINPFKRWWRCPACVGLAGWVCLATHSTNIRHHCTRLFHNSHVPVPIGKVRCYQCGEEFDSKNTMMIHRKVHGGVKDCQRFINSTCDRGDHCWWNHQTTQQVFQQVKENLPPPIPQVPQNLPHQILVNMLTVMDLELKKIKEVLNIN